MSDFETKFLDVEADAEAGKDFSQENREAVTMSMEKPAKLLSLLYFAFNIWQDCEDAAAIALMFLETITKLTASSVAITYPYVRD